jgi:PAS domain S-box-containing protein
MTRILAVDDKEENAYYLRALLGAHGFAVDAARDGEEALTLARKSPPDLVISDLLMPVMDGYTLLREWKADNRLNDIPFIVYTATYTDPDDQRLALDLGADAFILKPTEPEDFLARVLAVQASARTAIRPPAHIPHGDETTLLKSYSEALVRKLEEKSVQLHEANRALIEDIAKREAVEKSLRESEARFQQISCNINEVFWIVDARSGRLLFVSPAYEKIWCRPIQELYDNPQMWIDTVHEEDRARVEAAAATGYADGTYNVQYRIVVPDGSMRWIQDRAFPVRDAAGAVERIVGVARDITENRKLEEHFRQVQKMEAVGQLAAGVAHDFNNMLAVIHMQAGLLAVQGTLSEKQTALLGEMEGVIQRAADLTRQLLTFSRRQTMMPRDMDLNLIVTDLSKMLWRILGEDIHRELKIWPEPLFINCDAGMMDQVVMNLTVNARDAMPEGGRLCIETSAVEFTEADVEEFPEVRAGSFACMRVTDTGAGIAPEILDRIFEPFFTTKDLGKGTGLGLATVFGIVQQHQGWISVESEVGVGTTFRVYFPMLSAAQVPQKAAAREPGSLRGHETILMVEDDPALRASVRIALTMHGYRILEASTGAGALEAWAGNRGEISLLLTDLVMPDGMNGKELARRLLAEAPELKVIYMSGYSTDVAGKDLVLEEGRNFLGKPFSAMKLVETVRRRLDE